MPEGATRTVVEQAMSSIVNRGCTTGSADAVIARRVDAGTCGIICATTDHATGWLRIHATIGAVGETEGPLLESV